MNFIICAEIAAGKDTVASMLPGKTFAFAADLKEVCGLLRQHRINDAYGLMENLFDGKAPKDMAEKLIEFSKYPLELGKDRKLYQDLGTTWARRYYPDIWVDSVRRKVKAHNGPSVITDCRFINEFHAFPDFHSIYVEASEEVRRQRMVSRDGEVKHSRLGHAAESQVRGLKELCRYTLVNNGTLEELRLKVDHMVAYLEFCETN
jgi:hypothetical protein